MGYRKKLIKLFTFLGGLYFFLEFVLPPEVFGYKIDTYHDQISNGFTAVGAMAIGLGLVNLLMVHGSKLIFLRKGWFDSSALLLGLALMTGITSLDWFRSMELADRATSITTLKDFSDRIAKDYQDKVAGVPAYWLRNQKLAAAVEARVREVGAELDAQRAIDTSPQHADTKLFVVARSDVQSALEKVKSAAQKLETEESAEPSFEANKQLGSALNGLAAARRELNRLSYKHTLLKRIYELLYQGLFVALGAAMFSLLGFYIAAAAYRAFRIRSAESALMMTAAVLVMLGQIPFGLWIWEGFPDVRLWLLSVPNSGAFRAIKIGAAVAGLVMAFRMWFSIETESFSEGKGKVS